MYAAAVVRAGVALLLLWAALSKTFTGPGPMRSTLSTLGFPGATSAGLAYILPATEVIAAFVVVAAPGLAASVTTSALGVMFAAAGGIALLRGVTVKCACFGSSQAHLGRRQLVALPLWLLAAATMASNELKLHVRASLGTAVIVLLATAVLARLSLTARQLRIDNDRITDLRTPRSPILSEELI
jgi:hypothetical protein